MSAHPGVVYERFPSTWVYRTPAASAVSSVAGERDGRPETVRVCHPQCLPLRRQGWAVFPAQQQAPPEIRCMAFDHHRTPPGVGEQAGHRP